MLLAIDVATETVETPEEVAEVLRRALEFVNTDKLIPRSNCRMAPLAHGTGREKLGALFSGADIVRAKLVGTAVQSARSPAPIARRLSIRPGGAAAVRSTRCVGSGVTFHRHQVLATQVRVGTAARCRRPVAALRARVHRCHRRSVRPSAITNLPHIPLDASRRSRLPDAEPPRACGPKPRPRLTSVNHPNHGAEPHARQKDHPTPISGPSELQDTSIAEDHLR